MIYLLPIFDEVIKLRSRAGRIARAIMISLSGSLTARSHILSPTEATQASPRMLVNQVGSHRADLDFQLNRHQATITGGKDFTGHIY